jgi:hypothetical protein
VKFLAFAGKSYYADGGWNDLVGSFDTLEAAKNAAIIRAGKLLGSDGACEPWWHVVDLESLDLVTDPYERIDPVRNK